MKKKTNLRLARYHEKIDYISKAVASFPYPPKNELEKNALYYQIITCVEAIVDIISMVVKDKGITVKDDLSNIQTLVERQYIEKKLGEQIQRANGLRNILIHRYNGVDDQIILESVKEIKIMVRDFLEHLEGILDEIGHNT